MKTKIHRFFAYGTLKRNQYFYNEFLSGNQSNFLGNGTTSNDYQLYVDSQPHLVKEKTDTPCKGELFEIDEDVLARLDKLEGVPLFYTREVIEVYGESGERVLAWAYLRHQNYKGKNPEHREVEFI